MYTIIRFKSAKGSDMPGDKLELQKPYSDDLKGVLEFSDFAEAEKTIHQLQKLCRKYSKTGDKKGVECCRKVALRGRRRAGLISLNKRVNLKNRLQKREISEWFRVWLETPSLFDDWLKLRKETEDFKKLL